MIQKKRVELSFFKSPEANIGSQVISMLCLTAAVKGNKKSILENISHLMDIRT